MDTAERHRLASQLFNGEQPALAAPHYARLIEQNPLDADAHFAYGRLTRYSEDDTTLKSLSLAAEHAQRLPPAQQIKLAYALGKANQDLGRFDDAFDSFAAGAALQARAQPYDWRSNFAMMRDAAATLTATRLSALPRPTTPVSGVAPIFVLGMPRSGSTLIEQILVSHSAVSSAGETKALQRSVAQHLIGARDTIGAAAAHWRAADLDTAANDYRAALQAHAGPDDRFVVDKLPGNFVLLGLIRKLLPDAIIVHSLREPYACLWSCFSTLFGSEMRFSYDLDTLGAYFREYQALLRHWRETLPSHEIAALEDKGATPTQPGECEGFLELRYETLVGGGETMIRALLDAVGLPFNQDCLEFHATARPIKTASVAQVRQPLYRSSIDLWQHYAARLRPALSRYLEGAD
ncbi:MAG: sulfotransferase [Pseudomonadota bacterium]